MIPGRIEGDDNVLKSIIIVTISVLHLGPVEDAYRSQLDYRPVERGAVSAETAVTWDARSMEGRGYLIMQPANRERVYLRFVENPTTEGHAAMTTHGWNATELLVTDPDTLAERLADSSFEIVGPPKDLWAAPNAPRAMQVIGPAGELLYLTRNHRFTVNTPVDRVFIMVLAGPSMAALDAWYSNRLGLDVGDPMPYAITMVSRALGLPMDTTYPLAIATVSPRFLIELDEYPPHVGARPVTDGFLPPGTSMVTFAVDDLAALDLDWRAPPQTLAELPYAGRRTAVTVGPAGEWIELTESESPAIE